MSTEMPEGWSKTRLGDAVGSIQTGFACGTHNRTAKGIPHLRPMNVSTDGKIVLVDLKFVPAAEVDREERWVRQGDVLFNNTNSPELVGKTAYYGEPGPRAFSNHMTRVRCRDGLIAPRFCAAILHQLWRDGFFGSVCNNHVSQASISRAVLLDTEIPLPPLAEQRRIVEKVESLLAHVNAARERLAKVPAILKRFRQAVLAAACSGRLTEEWRDQTDSNGLDDETVVGISREGPEVEGTLPNIPETWTWVRFGELARSLRMGTTVPPSTTLTGFPVLRSSAVRPGTVDLGDVRYLAEDESCNSENFIEEGDLLFTRLSGSLDYVANCARVPALGKRRVQYPDRLFRAKLLQPDFGPYIERCFASPVLRGFLAVASKSSAGHQRISMSAIHAFPIPVAPLREQHEIVRRIEVLFSLADTIEQRVDAATARTDKLTQAILARAFRGELVPTEAELARQEGRDYEPASVLLERVRAERAAAESGRESAKPRRTLGRTKRARRGKATSSGR